VKVDSAIIGSPSIITHPTEEIIDYAEKENISLIVMATHGGTGIRRWTLESTAIQDLAAGSMAVSLIKFCTPETLPFCW
jgi:hypothetical protein